MSQQASEIEVRIEITIAAPVERAFEVFTQRFNEFWPPAYRLGAAERVNVLVEPRPGGRWYELTADGADCDWGRVLDWDPPEHVALSWQISPEFRPEPDLAKSSRVDAWFTADGPNRTRVTLVHTDFERHGPDWRKTYEGVAMDTGWPLVLDNFAKLAAADG
ncbi:MAG TPA: SRPBCC family protein [Streptosporangiaceae bacterium]|jgi:uncharacterized protein YndB with AHSA1/START domain|nr:SRPBCC family protein [Streptosporangiaceae bacterium]